jgi:hypothetical protein
VVDGAVGAACGGCLAFWQVVARTSVSSSPESEGEFRLRKIPKLMRQGDFQRFRFLHIIRLFGARIGRVLTGSNPPPSFMESALRLPHANLVWPRGGALGRGERGRFPTGPSPGTTRPPPPTGPGWGLQDVTIVNCDPHSACQSQFCEHLRLTFPRFKTECLRVAKVWRQSTPSVTLVPVSCLVTERQPRLGSPNLLCPTIKQNRIHTTCVSDTISIRFPAVLFLICLDGPRWSHKFGLECD